MPFAEAERTWAALNADPAFARAARTSCSARAHVERRAGDRRGDAASVMLRLPALATAVVVAAVLLYWGAGLARRRSASSLRLEPLPPRGDYAGHARLRPERFHQLRLQEPGRLVEVRDATVYMKDVRAAALRRIAGSRSTGNELPPIARWSGT